MGAVILQDKYQFERAEAVSAKVTGKFKHHHRGFGAFPLVGDNLNAPEPDVAVDYITPRTPFHSPSQSPRSTPLPIRLLSPIPSASDSKPKQKEKVICEEDLMVEFNGT